MITVFDYKSILKWKDIILMEKDSYMYMYMHTFSKKLGLKLLVIEHFLCELIYQRTFFLNS